MRTIQILKIELKIAKLIVKQAKIKTSDKELINKYSNISAKISKLKTLKDMLNADCERHSF